jgi:hypothetical protein
VDLVWLVLALGSLLYAGGLGRSGWLCAYMGVDYRGYYAAAQIARQQGFAAIYDPPRQYAFQEPLRYRCPPGSREQSVLPVVAPYLPVFMLLFWPLPALDFSFSYYLTSGLTLLALGGYMLRFSLALGARLRPLALLQWLVCLPLISNLYLGQVNLWLVICLGEFTLALLKGRRWIGGFWLAGLLIKPHMLILLLPGMLLGRQRQALAGFGLGALALLGLSVWLAGVQGVSDAIATAGLFAGALIQTAAGMMNWRAMALNLANYLPPGLAWGLALAGMALTALLALWLWRRNDPALAAPAGVGLKDGALYLIFASLCATFAVSWHSHFYMWVLLLPFLAYFDRAAGLPQGLRAAWLLGPPLTGLLALWLSPGLARPWIGLVYLALNLLFLGWAARQQNRQHFEAWRQRIAARLARAGGASQPG